MTNRMDTEALRSLKERLRQLDRGWPTVLSAAADAIEQLEADRDRWKAMAGDATYASDTVHRLVKRALEDAAGIVEVRSGHIPYRQEIAKDIRSLSPEEIMKKEGL